MLPLRRIPGKFWLFKPAKEAIIGHPNKKPVFPLLHGEGFEIISLTAQIPAILQTEFIAMQGAYDIAHGIEMAFSQYTSGMRAFLRTGINGRWSCH
jgi:allophanate hydrolase subunit 2